MTDTALALTERSAWTPTRYDWCDACGTEVSFAFTKSTKNDQVLYFCCHHTHVFAAEMIANGWTVEDHTQKLYELVSNQ